MERNVQSAEKAAIDSPTHPLDLVGRWAIESNEML